MYHFDYSCFVGIFKNNVKNGVGEFIKRDGTVFEQLWENGFLTSEHKKEIIERNEVQIAGNSVELSKKTVSDQDSGSLPFNFEGDDDKQILESLSISYLNEAGPETLSIMDFNDKLRSIEEELNNKPVTKWEGEDVSKVLHKFGLDSCIENFYKNKVSGKALLLLNEEDMEELGIVKIGDKIKMRELIKKISALHQMQKKAHKKLLGRNRKTHVSKSKFRVTSLTPFIDSEPVIEEESRSEYTDKSKGDAKLTRSCHETKNLSELRIDRKSTKFSALKIFIKRQSSIKNISTFSTFSFKSEKKTIKPLSKHVIRSRSAPSGKAEHYEKLKRVRSISNEKSSKTLESVSLRANISSEEYNLDNSLKESTSSSNESEDSESGKHKSHNRFKFDYNDEIGPNLRNFLINKDDLEIIEQIGEGAYGQVYRGKYLKTNVAVKIFNKTKFKYKIRKNFIQEAELLCSFRSPFIVLFMGFCLNYKDYMIITEYMSQGSLYDLLHKKKAHISFDLTLNIIEQVAHGMNHLHEKKVLHCDLKSSNILVSLIDY